MPTPQSIRKEIKQMVVVFNDIKASPEMLDFCLGITSPKVAMQLLQQATTMRPLRGFRLTPDALGKPPVKEFLYETFHQEGKLQYLFANAFLFLLPVRDAFEFLALLGDEWIEHNWRRLFQFLVDPRALALTMLLSVKGSRMNRLGCRLARCHEFWKQKPDITKEKYGILMDLMITPFAQVSSSSIRARASKNLLNAVLLDDPARKYGDMANRLSEAEQSSQADREQRNEADKNAEMLARELAQSKGKAGNEIRTLKTKVEDLETKLAKLEEENGWLRTHGGNVPREWAESACDAHADNNALLDKAERILREQEERNLQYGTLKTLREDADRLHSMETRLREAMRISLSIHPGMNDIHRMVKQACDKADARLVEKTKDEELPSASVSLAFLQLRTSIRSVLPTADFRAELGRMRSFLDDGCMPQLLTKSEIAILRKDCDNRLELLCKATDTYDKGIHSIPEIWNLLDRKGELGGTTLVMDGYNVLLRSAEWQEAINGGRLTFADARNAFIRQCRNELGRLFKEVWLVFDGNDEEQDLESRERNVVVVYARRQQEEHNADLYIRDLFHGQLATEKAWLATEDYGLRHEVEDTAGAFLPVHALMGLLRASGEN